MEERHYLPLLSLDTVEKPLFILVQLLPGCHQVIGVTTLASFWAVWWSSKKKEYCCHIRWLTPSANLCHWTRHNKKPSWGCVITRLTTVHHTVKPKLYQWAAERVSSVVLLQMGLLNYLVTLTTLLLEVTGSSLHDESSVLLFIHINSNNINFDHFLDLKSFAT